MGEEKLPTIEEAVDELKRKPVVDLWPILVAYGVSKGTIYAMAARGEVDVLRAGRLKKAVSGRQETTSGAAAPMRRLGSDHRKL